MGKELLVFGELGVVECWFLVLQESSNTKVVGKVHRSKYMLLFDVVTTGLGS